MTENHLFSKNRIEHRLNSSQQDKQQEYVDQTIGQLLNSANCHQSRSNSRESGNSEQNDMINILSENTQNNNSNYRTNTSSSSALNHQISQPNNNSTTLNTSNVNTTTRSLPSNSLGSTSISPVDNLSINTHTVNINATQLQVNNSLVNTSHCNPLNQQLSVPGALTTSSTVTVTSTGITNSLSNGVGNVNVGGSTSNLLNNNTTLVDTNALANLNNANSLLNTMNNNVNKNIIHPGLDIPSSLNNNNNTNTTESMNGNYSPNEKNRNSLVTGFISSNTGVNSNGNIFNSNDLSNFKSSATNSTTANLNLLRQSNTMSNNQTYRSNSLPTIGMSPINLNLIPSDSSNLINEHHKSLSKNSRDRIMSAGANDSNNLFNKLDQITKHHNPKTEIMGVGGVGAGGIGMGSSNSGSSSTPKIKTETLNLPIMNEATKATEFLISSRDLNSLNNAAIASRLSAGAGSGSSIPGSSMLDTSLSTINNSINSGILAANAGTVAGGSMGHGLNVSSSNARSSLTNGLSDAHNKSIKEQKDRIQKDRHNKVERTRRNRINDRIEYLGKLIPQKETPDKRTKGNILINTIDHVKHLQSLTKHACHVEERLIEWIKVCKDMCNKVLEQNVEIHGAGNENKLGESLYKKIRQVQDINIETHYKEIFHNTIDEFNKHQESEKISSHNHLLHQETSQDTSIITSPHTEGVVNGFENNYNNGRSVMRSDSNISTINNHGNETNNTGSISINENSSLNNELRAVSGNYGSYHYENQNFRNQEFYDERASKSADDLAEDARKVLNSRKRPFDDRYN